MKKKKSGSVKEPERSLKFFIIIIEDKNELY